MRRIIAISFTAVATLIAGITIESLAFAFRSGRDIPVMSGTERVRFERLPVRYQIASNVPAPLRMPDVEGAVAAAMTVWSSPSCSAAEFVYDGSTPSAPVPGDGVNTIGWVVDWSSRNLPGDAAAYTDVQYARGPDGTWRIGEADIYLNPSVAFGAGLRTTGLERSLTVVLAHELGHLLGLQHPCELDGVDASDGAPLCGAIPDASGSLMYPVTTAAAAPHLSQDDVAGICFLYPRASCEATGCPQGQACVDGVCQSTCFGEICAAGTVCTQRGCRRPDQCGEWNCIGHACTVTAECGTTELCEDGICVVGTVPEGEPCTHHGECAGGLCLSDGYCAIRCRREMDCGGSGVCIPADETRSYCLRPTSRFGAACAYPKDCTGGACLEGAGPTPICTRACSPSGLPCPADWSCTELDAGSVCVPDLPPVPAGGGCTVVSGRVVAKGASGLRNSCIAAALLTVCVDALLRPARRRRGARGAAVSKRLGTRAEDETRG